MAEQHESFEAWAQSHYYLQELPTDKSEDGEYEDLDMQHTYESYMAGVAKFKRAFMEWSSKTDFIQDWMNEGKLPAKYLGWHRADIMRDLLETYFLKEK